jgi:hypothetical protein
MRQAIRTWQIQATSSEVLASFQINCRRQFAEVLNWHFPVLKKK